MRRTQSLSGMASPLFQQASQPSPHVAIDRRKHVGLAVLEIPIPAAQASVHIGPDLAQAASLQSRGLLSHPFLQLLEALIARPFQAALAVIPQKVKGSGRTRVHHARLFGMQCQPLMATSRHRWGERSWFAESFKTALCVSVRP